MSKVTLTAELIEAFAGMFLSPRYDDPQPTPVFHRECWNLYCSPWSACMVIAPRDHAKSTGLTFDYILAEALFRCSDYIILIGSTEEMAAEQLSNIREELQENDELRSYFGVRDFEQDSKTDIIVRMSDGHRFRVLARGAEQKIRGKMWKGKRPNLMVADDCEDDEQVENRERRAKFRRWFFRAAKQALSQSGKVRVHGTILHEDGLLARLQKNSAWKHLFFKAHESFDDFSGLLWPERWTEAKLRGRRQEFIDDGDAAGYAQEFLNDPQDNSEAFLRREDFLPMVVPDDFEQPMLLGVGVDFAISKKDAANRTSFTIGGQCVNNLIHVRDARKGRWGSLAIIDEFFSIHERWHPDFWWVEDGQIWLAIKDMLYKEMQRRGKFLNVEARRPVSDKAVRGRPYQKRHRAGAMRFDKTASWYPSFEEENLKFRPEAEALLDDQFDSTALLCAGFESLPDLEVEDFDSEEEVAFKRADPKESLGRNKVTGY